MGESLRILETMDGRRVAYAAWGDPDDATGHLGADPVTQIAANMRRLRDGEPPEGARTG